MKKNLIFRMWFYFRQGWATYFAFIFAAINTSVVTYYLAIEQVPSLKEIFPSFLTYLLIMALIGVPLLGMIGYFHYKRIPAYGAEVSIGTESNPYIYKIAPGWQTEIIFPLYHELLNALMKLSKNEKLTDQEILKIKEIQNKIELSLQGKLIGKNIPRSVRNLEKS